MSNDIYKGPLFSDGEGFETSDFNALRDYQQARSLDQVLRHRTGCLASANDPDQFGSGNSADTMLQQNVYTVTGGECALRKGSANNKVSVTPGTLLMWLAAPDGNSPQLVPYTVAAGEVDIAIANGSGNPRIDILQVKLEWEDGVAVSRDFEDASTRVKSTITPSTQRRAKATWSVKQGTAAVTPSYPAPDAGYALVGSVFVGSTYAGIALTAMWPGSVWANGSATMQQCTVPLDVECHNVYPVQFDYAYATNWARGTDGAAEASGAATDLRVWCPIGSTCKRVVAIELLAGMVATDSVKLRSAFYLPGGGLASSAAFDLSSIMNHAAPNFGKFAHLGQIADASPDNNPSSANGPIGDAYWSGGERSGPAQRYQEVGTSGPGYPTEAHTTRAYLEINAGTGSLVYAVRWWLAG